MYKACILFLIMTWWSPLIAQTQNPETQIRVTNIIDGACFQDENSRTLCLEGVLAPQLETLKHESRSEPFARQAREWLYVQLFNRSVYITETASPDRWGRIPVMVWIDPDKPPVQVDLVSQGQGRVNPQTRMADSPYQILIESETTAQADQAGMWFLNKYQILSPDMAKKATYETRTVHGTVMKVAVFRDHVYFNFGLDYKTDFTVTMPGRFYRKLVKQGYDLQALEGEEMTVTGFVTWQNGPSIEVTNLRQINGIIPVSQSP